MELIVENYFSLQTLFEILSLGLEDYDVFGIMLHGKAIEDLSNVLSQYYRRGLQKKLIAQVLNIPIRDIQISRQKHGKPVCSNLFFSHANVLDAWIYVFSKKFGVGIDLEKYGKKCRYDDIVRLLFHPQESIAFYSCPHLLREAYFLELWTKKEAIAKCAGKPLIEVIGQAGKNNSRSFKLRDYQVAIDTSSEIESFRLATLQMEGFDRLHAAFYS